LVWLKSGFPGWAYGDTKLTSGFFYASMNPFYMIKNFFLFLVIILLNSTLIAAQYLYWTGAAASPDFFDESNWLQSEDNAVPPEGTLDPGSAINLNLEIENAPTVIFANAAIDLGTGSLTLINAELTAPAVPSGSVTIGDDAYLELTEENPFSENTSFDLLSGIGWLKLPGVPPGVLQSEHLQQFLSNGQQADYPSNFRIDNYYHRGCLVRRNDPDVQPLRIFDQAQMNGTQEYLQVDEIYQGDDLPGQMNNNIHSFILKRGFMATVAQNEDGTGLSKVFIASEEDVIVPEMPAMLNGVVSFIRVVPWNWVAKKGIGGNVTGLHETWYYNWGLTGSSTVNREIAPMAWGHNGASNQSVQTVINNKYVTHFMGFNEPDNCDDQSGQWYNMCQTDVAVERYRLLMKSGLRMVSPGTREEHALDWLKEFYNKATERDLRIDVIAIHWYDWGGNPANTPNANPQNVFNRFKQYLTNVYEYYELPIWITEFNANIHRNTSVHQGFFELAIPYLESLDYIERYAWFQPFSDAANYYENGEYTDFGLSYRDFVSTPAVAEPAWAAPNNLDGKIADPVNTQPSQETKSIQIYPNPASQVLYIKKQLPQMGYIRIYDMMGTLVDKKQITSEKIDISQLNSGTYFIRIGEFTKRFIKL
jgi:hypothetical protein